MNKLTNNADYLNHLRHSAAHLLAAAVMELWPRTKRTIGPAIEDGFYYDFDFGDPSTDSGQAIKISEGDLPKIEAQMRKILPMWKEFRREEVSAEEARKRYVDNPYKIELINEFVMNHQPLTIYHSGSYSDLCRGGHVEHPDQELKHFKLLSIAGAYWRGSEKNKMLTRIYGTAFPSKEELDHYLWQQEEAKKRDNRKLGKELELFLVSDQVGPGLVLWLPKGTIVKEELEKWAIETERAWGYQRVSTPVITKSGLYYTSGHLPYYKKDMFPPMVVDEGEEYYLKPMNCPHHHMIYASKPRSYRDLPLRLAEYGLCHRYESSGELFGLMRVRGFTQNDAHIYCREDQAVEEFVSVMKLHEHYYQQLGIKEYHLELALRDPNNKEKYHGGDDIWQKAEALMRKAVKQVNIPMVEQRGNAAFYGPKIDFIIRSSIGKEFAVSTNQIDLFMGGRFELTYVDNDGSEKTPAIIHRAPLGSHERFIGFLIEHFAGAFPTWLAPVQVAVLPVSEKSLDYALKVSDTFKEQNIRVFLDDSSETIGKKIREAEHQKIPYMLIVGPKEVASNAISVRMRGEKNLGSMKLEKFIDAINKEISSRALVSPFTSSTTTRSNR